MLREGFVNCWVLAKELEAIAASSQDAAVKELCQRVRQNYQYPVDSVLIAPDLRVLGHKNVNEVMSQPALYLSFLQQALAASGQPSVAVAAEPKVATEQRPRSLVLTPDRPQGEILDVVQVRGFGKSGFRYHSIDATAFATGGTLEIEARLGDGSLAATFELCAPMEIPGVEPRTKSMTTGPVQQQSVARGAACTLRHEFKEGTRLGFAVRPGSGNEGDHNAYFAVIRIKR